MSTLVKMLRESAADMDEASQGAIPKEGSLDSQAADEIERHRTVRDALAKALKELVDECAGAVDLTEARDALAKAEE